MTADGMGMTPRYVARHAVGRRTRVRQVTPL